jgi:predicted phosphodiesterase
MKKLLLILFLLASVCQAADLKFVQVSDVHYAQNGSNTTYKLIGESPRLLDDAVGQINEIPGVSFVMFTGDVVDQPQEKELAWFLDYANKLKYPTYFAFGNHDIGKTMSRERFAELTGMPAAYYTFVPKKGFRVIVLDAVTPVANGQVNGRIDKAQFEWLEQQYQNSPDDVMLIFMHHPIIEPFPSSTHKFLNGAELDAVLHKYKNPTAVFTGHYHACKITQNENILYISSPALVTYPNAFRVVNVSEQRKKVVFDIRLQETGLKKLQKTAKLFMTGSALTEGEEKDRNGVYELRK